LNKVYKLTVNLLSAVLITIFAQSAAAHSTGENYAFLNVEEDVLRVRLEFHESDVEAHFGFQLADEAPSIEALEPVLAYVLQNFKVWAIERSLKFGFTGAEVLSLPQGRFLQLHLEAVWPTVVPDLLTVEQTLFFEKEPRHRGLLLIEHNAVTDSDFGEEYTALVFSPDKAVQELDLVNVPGLLQLREFLWQGAWHILIGYDHILFLLSLLLTAVVARQREEWVAEERFQKSLLNVAGIVTVFTIAHSVSLSLAALEIIKLPSQPVEIVIALSIIVMALNNLRPFVRSRWLVIFVFGLFHGLGFATVMGHLTFRMVDLVKVMVLFNVGVELGQIAIVLIVFPLLFLVRRQVWFVPFVVRGGSALIAAVATYWLIERAFT
jgi:hypothetical protein